MNRPQALPPAPPPQQDWPTALVVGVFTGVFTAIGHTFTRLWHQPIKGLIDLLWGIAALTVLLTPHLRIPNNGIALGVVLIFVVIMDQIPRGILCTPWPWNRPPPPPPPPPYVLATVQDRVYGFRYRRTWDEATGKFVRTPQVDGREALFHGIDIARLSKISVGPSGCGKTWSCLLRDAHWIRRTGQHGTLIDPKGLQSDEYPSHIFTHIFNPSRPEISMRWNIYGDLPPAEAAALLVNCLIPTDVKESAATEYFAENARIAGQAIFVAHYEATAIETHLGRVAGEYASIVQLFEYLSDPKHLERLAERLPEGSVARLDLNRQIRLAGGSGDPLGTLYNKLAPLARSSAVKLLCGPGEGISLQELVNQPGTLVGFGLNVGKLGEVAKILGRLALAQWTYTILDDAVNRDHFKMMICDETADFLSSEDHLLRGMEKARSHNAGYSLAFQHFGQFSDDRQAARFYNAAGVCICWGRVEYHTAEMIAQNSGGRERVSHNHSQATTIGRSLGRSSGDSSSATPFSTGAGSHASRSTGSNTGSSSSQSEGFSEHRQFRWDWLPTEIQNLPEHHALISLNRSIPDPERPYDPEARIPDICEIAITGPALLEIERRQDDLSIRHNIRGALPEPITGRENAENYRQSREQLHDLAGEWATWQNHPPTTPLTRLHLVALEAEITRLVADLTYLQQPTATNHVTLQTATHRGNAARDAWQSAENAAALPRVAAGTPAATDPSTPAHGVPVSPDPAEPVPPDAVAPPARPADPGADAQQPRLIEPGTTNTPAAAVEGLSPRSEPATAEPPKPRPRGRF